MINARKVIITATGRVIRNFTIFSLIGIFQKNKKRQAGGRGRGAGGTMQRAQSWGREQGA